MAQHLRFVLDGDDHLTPALVTAGNSSAQLHRRLNDDMTGNATAVRRFTQDANGRLRDLNGRFVSVADAQRMMAAGIPVVTRRLGDLGDAGGDASAALGKSGGGLGGTMMGVAAVAAVSLLPAIGALVPMMAGVALAAGTMKLGFAGVGDALEAQTQGSEEYAKALKKLPAPAREFTRELVSIKKEFSGVGKEIQKAMLPGFTRALKDAKPVVDILGDSMVDMGKAFGDAAAGVGRMLKDSGFRDDLQANLRMGTQFVRDMTAAMGPFTRSLLDFGAASGPTLKAFTDGLGGLFSKGLPSMFEGLKPGISGTAQMLDGLFSAVNDVLGGLGRMGGEFGKTMGPVFGGAFAVGGKALAGAMDLVSGAMVVLRPVLRDVGYGFKTILDVGRIIGPTMSDTATAIMSTFAPVGQSIDQAVGPLQRLNQWINDNKVIVLEGARIFGSAMIDMTTAALLMAPPIMKGFRLMANGILDAIGFIVTGSAAAFGKMPLIGDQFIDALGSFTKFKKGFKDGLGEAERSTNEFVAGALPKLSQGKLKMNIANWTEQLNAAKAKLKTVPADKKAALKATIADLQAKVTSAKAALASVKDRSVTVTAYVQYKGKSIAAVSAGRLASGGLVGRDGLPGYPGGGLIRGVGTPTSDSNLIWASRDEYMVKAASVKKYGVAFMDALNAGRLPLGGIGGSGGADAARGLVAGMTGSTGAVMAGARQMAAAVSSGVRAELEIASPSKKMAALAKDIGKGLIVGMTGTRDKIKATAADLATDIRTAFSGKKESSLLKYVDKQTTKLLDAAAKRDKVIARIAEAKQFAKDITSSARDSAGLGSLGMSAEEVTAGGIKAGLGQKLAQIKQFTSYIGILAKKGLNKSLLRQILSMGPEAGYTYASALVGADKATFASINSLQSQINKGSDTLGKLGADAMYDSGKNASKGFLAGLASQQKAIEQLMLDIAKGMQKSIKKALGIKSPSTVMARVGAFSTQGLARGLVQGMPVLDRALGEVAGRVAGTQPVLGRAAVAGAGGGMAVSITINGATDPAATAREVERLMNKLKRGRGGAAYGFG